MNNSSPKLKGQEHIDPRVQCEQQYVDRLFGMLDQEVERAQERLRQVMLRVDPANPDAEALVERETEYHGLNEKIDRLNLAGLGLVFGRIDVHTEDPAMIDNPVTGRENIDRRYIGRMGLLDTDDDYRSLLLDWRAPLARPFYLATTAHPLGVETRRHIRTKGRTVEAVDEEVLTSDAYQGTHVATSAGDLEADHAGNVASESALLRAINAARGEHMTSIVQTIQREQDEIIRDETRGVMVVEGGPGTGKTAVALHRVAYLLYTWRDYLSKTGVLILGPNRKFLDYISRVLPELGETGVVLSTIGELYPGVQPTPGTHESLLAQEVKGSAEMVTILQRLVKHHQQLPAADLEITVENITLYVTQAMVKTARTRARRARRPHNEAQPVFKEALVDQLASQLADKIGADPLGGQNLLSSGDRAQLHDDLLDTPQVEQLVEQFWPNLEPTAVLAEMFGSKHTIEAVAFDYDEETQRALYREEPEVWTPSDAALLDELAVLIGIPDPEQTQAEHEARWREQLQEASDALEILRGSANTDLDDESDAEILSAHDVIDAQTLAQRQQIRDNRTTAQRAATDQQWAYGHIIIDEAQELTPMQWRMVMRRSPSKWITLVGDTSQTGNPAGVDSWADALRPFVAKRFRTHQLTVNYRTPAEIMDFANQVLARFAPEAPTSTSIRSVKESLRYFPTAQKLFDGAQAASTDLVHAAARLAAQQAGKAPERLTTIIAAASIAEEVRAALLGNSADVQVYTVDQIKGLEFDHVVLLEPAKIVGESPQGWQDLYVALTRATQTLSVLGELPSD